MTVMIIFSINRYERLCLLYLSRNYIVCRSFISVFAIILNWKFFIYGNLEIHNIIRISYSRASKKSFVQHNHSTVSIKIGINEISNHLVSNHRLFVDEMAQSALIATLNFTKMQATGKYLK